MAKGIKDIDYLAISAQIRAMETRLLTGERMERLIAAKQPEEIAKILADCDYNDLDPSHPEAMDAALSKARASLLEDLAAGAPDPGYIDIYRLKYDYHNIKVLLKAPLAGVGGDELLSDAGRIPAAELKEALSSGDEGRLPSTLTWAAAEAKDVLETTRDPQASDAVLDRWMFQDMTDVAEKTGSPFLIGYVKLQIDAMNLRTLVRSLRMGKSAEFIQTVLCEGGEISVPALITAAASRGGGLEEQYGPTLLGAAAQAGIACLDGGSLTAFEKACDDGVCAYLEKAGTIPFGEAVLVAYLAARETEFTNLRIILMGKTAGLAPELIQSRLRSVIL